VSAGNPRVIAIPPKRECAVLSHSKGHCDMSSETTVQVLARVLYQWTENTIGLIGVILATSSAVTLIAFWVYDFVLPGPPHPYIGILLFLILPSLFLLGLILIPIGILLHRRKLRETGELPESLPSVSLQTPRVRNTLLFVGLLTFLNILIFTFAAYKVCRIWTRRRSAARPATR